MKRTFPLGLAATIIFCMLTSITLFEHIYRPNKRTASTKNWLETQNSRDVFTFFCDVVSSFKPSHDQLSDTALGLYLPQVLPPKTSIDPILSIHIITFNRPRSLKTLLQQLDQAKYDQATYGAIDLYVRIDFGAPEEVKSIANNFVWNKGWKNVVFSPVSKGVRGMWTSIVPRSPHEVLLIFEDDARVSPYCLLWTQHLLEKYGGYGSSERDPSIFGLSLSPVRLDEISYPFRPWNASKFLGEDQQVFLHSVPSSWGAVMFGDRWQHFLDFYAARTSDGLYNVSSEPKIAQGPDAPIIGDPGLAVPGSRSNVWPKSWKRFLIDYCFGRGLVTLYTHVPGNDDLGMATTFQLSGEHVVASKNASLRVPHDYSGYSPTAAMHRNPRVGNLLKNNKLWSDLLRRPLAASADLTVFDLWGRPTTRSRLAQQGRSFLAKLQAKDPNKYRRVLHAWMDSKPLGNMAADIDTQAGRAILEQAGSDKPVPLEKLEPEEKHTERFLVYQPQFGFSNQRIALRNAAYWAACLNRTLVVPPVFFPRVSAQWAGAASEEGDSSLLGGLVMMDQLFDLNGADVSWCKAKLRTESLTDFMARGLQPEQVLAIHPPMLGDQLSDRFFNMLGWSGVPRVRGHQDLCSDKALKRLLFSEIGGMKDRVLALDGLFRCGPGDRGSHRDWLLMRLQRPSPTMASALRKVNGVLERQGYATQTGCLCLQVRLGDFHKMCSLDIPWMAKHRNRGLQCIVNATSVQAEVNAWPGKCVQLLTNDEAGALAMVSAAAAANGAASGGDKSFLVQSVILSALKEVSSSLPPFLRVSQASEALSILFEEHMCRHASDAVLNVFSSLGASVSIQRAQRKSPTRFW